MRNGRGEYDRIALYKNKKAMEPIVVLEKDQFTPYVFDDAQVDDKLTPAFRNMRLLELAQDGTQLKLWVSPAVDLNNDDLWFD